MGVWRKKAGQWDQLGVDPMAVRWATVTGGVVTTVTNPDGSVDEVHTFTADGSLTVSASGYADVLLVGGAAGYCSTGSLQGGGGDIRTGLFTLPAGALTVVVGAGGPATNSLIGSLGPLSSVGALSTAMAGYIAGAGSTANTDPAFKSGLTSAITGAAQTYGASLVATPRANFGESNSANAAGSSGVVIVRVKVTPAPALPAATGWAQVTGGTVTEYTKPDGSVMEVHTFTAAGDLTVVQTGYADVLLVSGGSGGAAGGLDGAGGTIVSGLRALPAGVLAAVIGAGGASGGNAGTPSSLGALTTYYPRIYYNGAGAAAVSDATGLTSSITGSPVEYARGGSTTAARTNRGDGGYRTPLGGSSGIVIVAVQKTPPTASGVVASGGTETTFVGDGTNGVLGQTYKVHTFTTIGVSNFVVTQGGEVECLLVSGGGNATTLFSNSVAVGMGGRVKEQRITIGPGTLPVTVGRGGLTDNYGADPSIFSGINTGPAGWGDNGSGDGTTGTGNEYRSRISGALLGYGRAGNGGAPRANRGDGALYGGGQAGSTGVVVIRYKVAS